ncbi:MAG: hypothetical protein GX616_21525, partial [Planctomycetes bacterium]|nr:hypothetical protein [Planctomycetota bacterium]
MMMRRAQFIDDTAQSRAWRQSFILVLWMTTLTGSAALAAASSVPARSIHDDLVDPQTRQRLIAYLDDINGWIMTLDVGSGVLKNTNDTPTSIFINGNFARVLMASHAIRPNKARLDEALRW